MKAKLCVTLKQEKRLTIDQLNELATIVENQNTTDKDEPAEYEFSGLFGTYVYIIDEDYDVILKDVK